MDDIVSEAQGLQEELVAHRHYLHANPETDMVLPLTTAYVRARLEAMGYEAEAVCESGLVARVGGGKRGKVILLRADMDALPGSEETDLPFRATNGNMHACGHDLHTAMLLGAAKILKRHEDEIQGTVKLMFQPGEETIHGARAMVEAGVLESPKVDAAMMLHVFAGLPMPSGIFAVPAPGPSSAASDWFEIEVQGRGGHGAMPNFCVDPLNVVAHLHIALQEIVSREILATDSAVLTVGYIQGGKTNNVIPDVAKMGGTVRTFSTSNRDFIEKRIRDMAAGVAATFRAEAKVNYERGCPSVVNDRAVSESLKSTIAGIFGQASLLKELPFGGKAMGSEDFAFVSERVPSTVALLAAGSPSEGYAYSQHHPKVIFDEAVLYRGAAAYASFAINWLKANAS